MAGFTIMPVSLVVSTAHIQDNSLVGIIQTPNSGGLDQQLVLISSLNDNHAVQPNCQTA